MYKSVQNCQNCGATLTLDDMRLDNCPYCQTVYPHKSMGQQHAEVVNQMMGNMMQQQAQVQNQWRAAYGAPPQPPYGAPPPPGMPGSPYGNPQQIAQAHMAHAQQMSSRIMMTVIISIAGVFLLVGLIMVLTFAL
jgi:hypothetical protein